MTNMQKFRRAFLETVQFLIQLTKYRTLRLACMRFLLSSPSDDSFVQYNRCQDEIPESALKKIKPTEILVVIFRVISI